MTRLDPFPLAGEGVGRLPLALTPGDEMAAIFISHSSADPVAAAEMKQWLEAQGHTSLFLDVDPEAGIKGGSGWEQTLYQQLRQCQAVIALLTPNWLASKWCFAELVQARERGKAIFPVKVQPCAAGSVFSDIQQIDILAQPEEGYRRLRIGLLERGLDPLDVFAWNSKRPPYPGLRAFQEADAAIFFGRGEEILKSLETLDALRRQGRDAAHFVLLLGASGSGKSSLARAGVIPRLKKKPAEWLPAPPFRPQLEPLDELAMALAAAFEGQGRPRDWSAIRTELHTAAGRNPVDGLPLLGLVRDLAIAAQQPETTVLLTIDQAEELFGYSSPEAATRFLRLLRAALEAADQRLMAVATLRSDFLGEFQNHPALQDGEYPHHFRYQPVLVEPMPLRNFPAIIQGPARLAGVQLDDGLVEAMVQDTGTRDALPLLAFTLRRLYERYGGDGRLTVDEYESLGRLEGAVREEAQRVITEADPSPEDLEALHAAYVPTMVRINAEGAYARRRALFDNLPRRALPLLRRFVDARLLVTDRDPQGRETIEVAHEALLRTWPLLGGWLAEDQDKLRLLESIQRSAEEWDLGGRRDDLLVHRNGRLKDAVALLASPRFTVLEASAERAYLDACRAAQEAREAAEKEEQERRIRDAERIAEEEKKAAAAQKRTARTALVGLAVALLVAVLAGWQWWQAHRQGQIALARQLGAQTDLMRDQPEMLFRRLLLATEAMKRLHAVEAESLEVDFALRKELALLPRHVARVSMEYWHNDVTLSPDGRNLIVGDFDSKNVRVWEIATGKELVRFEGGSAGAFTATFPGKVIRLQMAGRAGRNHMPALSSDGRYVVTEADDGSEGIVQVWETDTGTELLHLQLPGSHHYALSADGRYLAVSTQTYDRATSTYSEAITRVWDVRTRREIPGSAPGSVCTFSQDATVVATSRGLWEVTAELKQVFSWEPDTFDVVLTGDGGYVARWTEHDGQKQIEVWSRAAKKMTASVPTPGSDGFLQAVTPDGRFVILRDSNRDEVQVHDIAAKMIVSRARLLVRAAAVPSGQYLIASLHKDENNERVKDVDVWELRREGSDGLAIDHEDKVVAVGLTPLGGLTTIVQNSEKLIIRVWDVKTRREMSERVAQVTGTDAVFAPDGQSFAVMGDGGMEVRRVEDPEPVAKFAYANPMAVVWSPDGRYLAAQKERDVRVWDLKSRQSIGQLALPGRPTALALARGGDSLAAVVAYGKQTRAGELHHAKLWKVSTGEELKSFEPDKGQSIRSDTHCALSPDAQYLVTHDLKVIEMKTGVLLPKKLGLAEDAPNCVMSTDGRYLATSAEGMVRLWELKSGKEAFRIPTNERLLALDQESRYLATISDKNTVRVWFLRQDDLIEEACQRLPRNLSEEEWREYVGDNAYRKTCPNLPGPDDAPPELATSGGELGPQ